MVTKSTIQATVIENGKNLGKAYKDSAQQIWLAGLGAFAKAQADGSKAFESLVKEGQAIQSKAQATAQEKFAEVTSKASGMTGELLSKATGQWDKLEGIFEERVGKALKKMGIPTNKDLEALSKKIDALTAKKPAPKAVPKAAAKTAPKAAPAKKAAPVAVKRKAAK
jgi:poly(hydroxyalkanoate) granule-associated protein